MARRYHEAFSGPTAGGAPVGAHGMHRPMSTSGKHRPSKGARTRQELLYDPDVPSPSHAERARTLVGAESTATLCSAGRQPEGYPYGSFVTFALDGGAPVLLVSTLAEHTKNLSADPRCSLLVARPGEGDPLARGRVTLVGQGRELPADNAGTARDAFLSAHPGAAYYVDFRDFAFWRIEVEAVRYIGGYGRMSWVDASHWREAEPDPIAPMAAGIIDHMNADHADAMVTLCRALSKATDTTAARLVEVDRYGFEMSATTGDGPRPIRLGFSGPVSTAAEVRAEMVALVGRARELVPPLSPSPSLPRASGEPPR